jgi:hypothetical protein
MDFVHDQLGDDGCALVFTVAGEVTRKSVVIPLGLAAFVELCAGLAVGDGRLQSTASAGLR